MNWIKTAVIFVVAIILIIFDLLPNKNSGKLSVTFIETGKSDSIFIKMPDGETVLIDGGLEDSFGNIHDVLLKNDVKTIDYMINTHQHDDHLGAFSELLKVYDVKNFYMPETDIENEYYEKTIQSLEKKNIPVNIIKRGNVICDGDAKIEVLAPYIDYKPSDENNYSAVLLLTYKEKKFLFTADAQRVVLNNLVLDYGLSHCDVIKISHHGSKDANSGYFLKKVTPDYAVVTSKNREEYIEKLLSKYVKNYYFTCDSGNVTMICDGKNIEVKTERKKNEN